jgi:hypothetical protein
LSYHFETQPLPSPLAWYAHQFPDGLLRTATGAMFAIELAVPFLVFLPRRPRLAAFWAFLLLQGIIVLTGNYNFFNLLVMALCVFLLDEGDLRKWLGGRLSARIEGRSRPPSPAATAAAAALAAANLLLVGGLAWVSNTHRPPPEPFYTLLRAGSAFGIANGYGPFAVMTRERREIIVEGSEDGETWRAYEFPHKPGALHKPLAWNVPHQPRLDWQMWFAALGDPRAARWFPRLLGRLEEGSPAILDLFGANPFPDRPPRRLRASLYRYRFATPEERAAGGAVWQREYLGPFEPGG